MDIYLQNIDQIREVEGKYNIKKDYQTVAELKGNLKKKDESSKFY